MNNSGTGVENGRYRECVAYIYTYLSEAPVFFRYPPGGGSCIDREINHKRKPQKNADNKCDPSTGTIEEPRHRSRRSERGFVILLSWN